MHNDHTNEAEFIIVEAIVAIEETMANAAKGNIAFVIPALDKIKEDLGKIHDDIADVIEGESSKGEAA